MKYTGRYACVLCVCMCTHTLDSNPPTPPFPTCIRPLISVSEVQRRAYSNCRSGGGSKRNVGGSSLGEKREGGRGGEGVVGVASTRKRKTEGVCVCVCMCVCVCKSEGIHLI